MKDRFKFRAWIKNEKRYGYLLNLFNCGADAEQYEVEEYDEQGDYYTVYSSDEVVLQQCTGLKDKNDKLIFEGDIIKLNEKYPDYTATDDFFKNQNYAVEFFQPQAKFLLKPSEYRDNSGDGICELSPDFYEFLNWDVHGIEYYVLQGIEVIGNAFENPELLEDL